MSVEFVTFVTSGVEVDEDGRRRALVAAVEESKVFSEQPSVIQQSHSPARPSAIQYNDLMFTLCSAIKTNIVDECHYCLLKLRLFPLWQVKMFLYRHVQSFWCFFSIHTRILFDIEHLMNGGIF